MNIWAKLLAAGRSMGGLARRREYRLMNGPAVPTINRGRNPAYGNGLAEQVREAILRATNSTLARGGNPFAVDREEPGNAQTDPPQPAGLDSPLSLPPEVEAATGPAPQVPVATVQATTIALSKVASSPKKRGAVAAVAAVAAVRRLGGWVSGWLRRGRFERPPMVQAELRLEAVKPLRSALGDDHLAAGTGETAAGLRDAGSNPFTEQKEDALGVPPRRTSEAPGRAGGWVRRQGQAGVRVA